MEYQHFLNIFIEVLNKHAPMKQKSQSKSREIYDKKLTQGNYETL